MPECRNACLADRSGKDGRAMPRLLAQRSKAVSLAATKRKAFEEFCAALGRHLPQLVSGLRQAYRERHGVDYSTKSKINALPKKKNT
jgi:predicted phage gp36 major capsid-like protein